VDAEFQHITARLEARTDLRLGAIFGPQHGFRADVQDNMIETPHARDASRRVPVYSLYSETREPTAEMLKDIDVLVVDLQDVGSRIYTFIYTMAHCLRAGKKHGVPVIVCDRPNPIGGITMDGPMLVKGFESFVGQFPIPLRHGMTIGELARFFNDFCGINAELSVMPMEHWRRSMHFDETGIPWVMPSPNMPTPDTALVYPGQCLFEATNVSEGRGTTRPFEIVGAPFLDGHAWAAALAETQLAGLRLRPIVFRPTFHKFGGQACGGVQLHVTDAAAFRPYRTGVALIAAARKLGGDAFRWRTEPYEFVAEPPAIDLLTGSAEVRMAVEAGASPRDIEALFVPFERAFAELRQPALMPEYE